MLMNEHPELPAKNAFFAAMTGTMIHSMILVLVWWWAAEMIPRYTRVVAQAQMKLPSMTESVISVSQAVIGHPLITLTCLLLFLFLDFWVLYYLGRPSCYRVLREIWTGFWLGLAVLSVCVASFVLMLPFLVVIEKISSR